MKSACRSVLPSPDGLHHAEEAFELLQAPGFFSPEVMAADVRLDRNDSFTFASPVASGIPENDVVRGRLVRAGPHWRTKPSVILLHGWNAELQYRWMLPFWSELMAWRGLNAISFELPYHSLRRPTGAGTIRNFLSGNLLHFLRATQQALADTRALAAWLRQNGSPSVGIMGTSLGGWLSGLAISHMPELTTAALLTPVSRIDLALRDMPFGSFMREQAGDFATGFPLLNLAHHQPLCSRENVLIVAARHDLFAPAETIDELQRAWGAEVWRHSHGHITILMSSRIIRRLAKWMADRMTTSSRPELPTARAATKTS